MKDPVPHRGSGVNGTLAATFFLQLASFSSLACPQSADTGTRKCWFEGNKGYQLRLISCSDRPLPKSVLAIQRLHAVLLSLSRVGGRNYSRHQFAVIKRAF